MKKIYLYIEYVGSTSWDAGEPSEMTAFTSLDKAKKYLKLKSTSADEIDIIRSDYFIVYKDGESIVGKIKEIEVK